ncbi:hypothetical protein H4582DRAFT_1935301 [Lactarius indigo]|nr:hypothetical protein H4582DRAFT_1935301 [Lactarius indigo]
MIYFDASFGIAISAPLGAPASVEDGSITQSGHLDGVDSIFDCPEGRFFYDSGTLPHNTAGFEPEGGSASTFPHAEKPLTSVISCQQYATVATGDMSTNSTYLGSFTTTNVTPSTSATAPPLFADYGPYTHGFDLLVSSHRAGTFLPYPHHVCLHLAFVTSFTHRVQSSDECRLRSVTSKG